MSREGNSVDLSITTKRTLEHIGLAKNVVIIDILELRKTSFATSLSLSVGKVLAYCGKLPFFV